MTDASGSASTAADALSRGLIDCYFAGRNGQQLVKHQIDSYNDFVSRKLDHIIDGFNPIDICNSYMPEQGCYRYVLSVSLQNPTLSKPVINEKDGSTKVMLPNDARLRNLTYAAPLTVDMHLTAKTYSAEAGGYVVDTKRLQSVGLGRVPVMVRSRYCMLSNPSAVGANGAATYGQDECRYDYGGYFVINGSEKVVISQDRIAENRTYVFLNTKASCYSHVAEIRSVQEARFGVPKTLTLKLSSKANNFGRTIKLCIHHIKHDVPVFVMFRALGVESDKCDANLGPHESFFPRAMRGVAAPGHAGAKRQLPTANLRGQGLRPLTPPQTCMEVHGDIWQSMEVHGDIWQSMEVHGDDNSRTSMTFPWTPHDIPMTPHDIPMTSP